MSQIQAVVFINDDNKKWRLDATARYIKSQRYNPIKPVHKVYDGRRISQYRYRMIEPSEFKSFRTKVLPDNIHLILGFK